MTQINMSIFYQEAIINKELSISLACDAIDNLMPFSELPYIQNYFKVAFQVLNNWDIDVEKYLSQKYGSQHAIIAIWRAVRKQK